MSEYVFLLSVLHHSFHCAISKNLSHLPRVFGYKNPSRINAHIRKWRKIYARFVARPSGEQEILKDTSQLSTKTQRYSVRNVSKNLIAKMQWRGISKNAVFAAFVVSTFQTRLS